MSRLRPASLLLAFALGVVPPAFAHEGHDHGDAPALPTTYEPRFEARAGEVEVVGIVVGEDLWLYVNRYADNAPWANLKIEVEQGDKSVAARADGEGVYRLAAGPYAQPGKHAVVLTVQGAGVDELLTGDLIVTEATDDGTGLALPRWAWALGALAVAGGVGMVALRRRR